jgi:hypothetical protein
VADCHFCSRAKSGVCKRHLVAQPAAVEVEGYAAPAAPATVSTDLVALIQDLAAQVASLKDEVKQTKRGQSQFVPMQGSVRPASPREEIPRGRMEGSTVLPITGGGTRLNDEQLRTYRQEFFPGDRVRIRRDVTREGCGKVTKRTPILNMNGQITGYEREITPVSWGELLDKIGPIRCQTEDRNKQRCRGVFQVNDGCPVCGAGPTVHKVRYLSKFGEWKYVVRAPGLTGRENLGDGFHQYDLEPA